MFNFDTSETQWEGNNVSRKLAFFRIHIKFLSSYAHLFGFTVLLALLLPIECLQLGHHLAELIFELLKQIKFKIIFLFYTVQTGKVVKLIPFDCHINTLSTSVLLATFFCSAHSKGC